MRIASSNIRLHQNHYLKEELKEEESLEIRNGPNVNTGRLSAEEQAKNLIQNNTTVAHVKTEDMPLEAKDRIALMVAERLLSQVTGKKEKIRLCCLEGNRGSITEVNTAQSPGIDYKYSGTKTEAEGLNFKAEGIINTSDGKNIKIDLDLNLSRKYAETHNIEIKTGSALKDPLVINFDGPSASLTDTKYQFDIDSDGTLDTISFVRQGSGFLGIDKNMNGIIDNGKELFGPDTGSGFLELSQYDYDNNGWIDENDSVFNNLRIWTKDIEGKDYLYTLKEKNIGAIYLENINAQFSLKDASNQLQGQIKSGGIFLSESGRPGFISEIDLAV